MIDPELWRRLSRLEPEAVARRALVRLAADGRYEVPVLGSQVWVDVAAEEVTSAWPEVIAPDYLLAVSVVQYLILAEERERAGELVSAAELPYGEVFFRGPHALPGEALGALFADDGERFREVLARLGGRPVLLADVGVRVEVYPRLPVWLGLWLADEEFSARVSFLFDRTAGAHLPVDALWSAVMVLAGAIRRLSTST